MLDRTPVPDSDFRVNWVKLNNELFGMIYRNAGLRARYEHADFTEAQEICADLFDVLVKDVEDFVDRFILRG